MGTRGHHMYTLYVLVGAGCCSVYIVAVYIVFFFFVANVFQCNIPYTLASSSSDSDGDGGAVCWILVVVFVFLIYL